jgi:hypothetical protein
MATIASSSDPIFRYSTLGGVSVRKPANESPSTPPVTAAELANDAKLAAIFDAPLAPGETAFDGYRNKEVQLVAAMAQLTVLESRALHARFANPLGADALAAKFMRLTIERRVRLLNFLADAPRRAALAGK